MTYVRIAPAPMLPGETLGAYRALPGTERARRQDEASAAGLLAPFPASWAGRLIARWRERRLVDRTAANLDHLERCQAIASAHLAGINPDSNDGELCQAAKDSARDMERRLEQRDAITPAEWPERVRLLARYAEALHWLDMKGLGVRALGPIVAFLRRVTCDRWWRRVLRRAHARAVESTARAIGLVHKRAGCYVSDDSMRRRTGQRARNARALESVKAVNEHGQDYTLAELAAKGPANREIRRHELMTRIAGFELIAKECEHAAYFVTVTCPSRMHAFRTKPGQGFAVEENPKHDGTTPDEAQRYLSKQWARFRAAADRAGLDLYGFRIAEPNHDGTPHWHALFFFPQRTARERLAYRVLVRLLRRYFLHNDSATERGARKHRVKVERIDWTRGSAAGYVAKYVAKNIDGYRVEKDLYGNDAMSSSQRVDAWAATWRIRQFQQIGGAPVTVWRELRRLHPEQEAAAPSIALALEAVNITSQAEEAHSEAVQRHTAATGWATYLHLQGGWRVRRAALRLRVLREQTGELGRYGELMQPRAVGIVTSARVRDVVPAFGILPSFERERLVQLEVESERSTWMVVPAASVEQARERMRGIQPDGEAVRPWSPVNNCTGQGVENPFIAPNVERTRKRGRAFNWNRGRSTEESAHHEPPPEHHRRH